MMTPTQWVSQSSNYLQVQRAFVRHLTDHAFSKQDIAGKLSQNRFCLSS